MHRPRLTRLPLLHHLQRPSTAENNGQDDARTTFSPLSTAIPPIPIAIPDRAASTRLLLQDTQACVQKFAARMDTLGGNVDQSLREIQLCRNAMEGSGDKCVSEIADVGALPSLLPLLQPAS